MATTGAAKAKAKTTPAAPPTVIEVTDGDPHKEYSYVKEGGTVQFDNRDNKGYRIRFKAMPEQFSLIDVLLPAVGSVTLMADPLAKKGDEVKFELIPTNLQHPFKGDIAASGGGGKIVIGPTPSPKKSTR